jgi:Kdo2-lipid IVA lauroyltransferase/acyltransferase
MARTRGPIARWFTRTIVYPIEGAVIHGFCALFAAMPVDAASALGGRLGRLLGPLLPGHRVALANLALVLPELGTATRRRIVRGMWDNLGRTMAEYPHIATIAAERIELVGKEHFITARDDGRAGIFITAHLANWEIPVMLSKSLGLDVAVVYREPNNPYVARLLKRLRGTAALRQIPKGPRGARGLRRLFAENGHVAMLIDQKLNDGIKVPFFGRPAMTVAAPAIFAERLDLPILPVRVERLDGVRFRVTVLPAFPVAASGDRETDTLTTMTRLNALLETWIRERPEQWLWSHRRWPESTGFP